MADKFIANERSRVMARVKSADTAPELELARLLENEGIRFRKHVAQLPGNPDFVADEANIAIFVHGCFWHGHQRCRRSNLKPSSNHLYWSQKVLRNQKRDRRVSRELRTLGFSVFTVWECDLSRSKYPTRLLNVLRKRTEDFECIKGVCKRGA